MSTSATSHSVTDEWADSTMWTLASGLNHSTHAHSAEAVAAEVSRENATSSEALRASRVIACPPRRAHAALVSRHDSRLPSLRLRWLRRQRVELHDVVVLEPAVPSCGNRFLMLASGPPVALQARAVVLLPHDSVILVGARGDRNRPSAFLAVPSEVVHAGALAGPVSFTAAAHDENERENENAPLHTTLPACSSDANVRLSVRMTASPISRMDTSIEDGCRESSRRPRRAPAPGLLNHLIRPLQQRLRDRQAERFRGFQVDDQLPLSGERRECETDSENDREPDQPHE